MSVTGEFERYAAAVLASLRDADAEHWHHLARKFERNLEAVHDDLPARARVMLDGDWLLEDPAAPWPVESRDALEAVLAISRIILGRSRADNS